MKIVKAFLTGAALAAATDFGVRWLNKEPAYKTCPFYCGKKLIRGTSGHLYCPNCVEIDTVSYRVIGPAVFEVPN